MKKFISLVLVTVMCFGLFGCESTPSEPEAPKEVDVSQFPEAKEFDVFEWPTFGVGAKLPIAMWSNRGDIRIDGGNASWIQVGYSTLDDYKEYVTKCQDAGFVENYRNISDTAYFAENADGHSLSIRYNKSKQLVDIRIGDDAMNLYMLLMDESSKWADEFKEILSYELSKEE